MPEVLQKLDNMSHRCLKIFTLIPHSQLEKSTPKMKVMISMLKLYPPSFLCSFSSVQFNGSVVFKYLWPHGLQHTRLPCPSPTPRAYSNSCPSSQWCHQSSCHPLSSPSPPALKSFPASGFFQMSKFYASGGQSIGVSASASVSPSNEYSGLISFRIDWFDLLAVRGTLKSLFQHHSSKAYQFFGAQLSL